MSLSFAGLVASVGLPAPWGVVSSGGVVIRAHGVQIGQDTTSYSVNFASSVPASGSVTAYLAATPTTIQQDPFPLTGPPQGHPSFNPNFVPSVAYATTAYSVALSATTTPPDNVTTFELARTTLTVGQASVSSFNIANWRRAAPTTPAPAAPIVSGGLMPLSQTALTTLPTANNLTSTLPLAVSGGGLSYRLVNPSATTVWTVASSTGNTIAGSAGTPVNSIGIPPYGSLTVWANSASGVWEIMGVNPLMMASLPNIFTAPQTINVSTNTTAFTVIGTGSLGANVLLTGNGTATPNKYIRVINGHLTIVNSNYSVSILDLDDTGNLILQGAGSFTSLTTVNNATIGNALTVTTGGIYASDVDAGGMQFRTSFGNSAAAGFRNDGNNFYLLFSNASSPRGGYNGLRPFTVNLSSGQLTLDGTGAGIVCNGNLTASRLVGTTGNLGGVEFPGGGAINAPGAIGSQSSITGDTLTATHNITSNSGRLRAALGAYQSGDPNAAVILADFYMPSGIGVLFLPNGFIIQWGVVNVPGNNTPTLFNLPTAFPNSGIQIVGSFGAHTPPQQAVGFDLANNAQFWATNTASPGPGNGCYFMAIGV